MKGLGVEVSSCRRAAQRGIPLRTSTPTTKDLAMKPTSLACSTASSSEIVSLGIDGDTLDALVSAFEVAQESACAVMVCTDEFEPS